MFVTRTLQWKLSRFQVKTEFLKSMFFINSSNTGRQIYVPNFHGNQWAQLSWWAVDQTGRHPAASRQSVKTFPSPVYPTCPSHIWFPPHHYICLNKWWNGKWNKVKRNLFILKLTYTLLQMIKIRFFDSQMVAEWTLSKIQASLWLSCSLHRLPQHKSNFLILVVLELLLLCGVILVCFMVITISSSQDWIQKMTKWFT